MHRLSADDQDFASAFFDCRIPAGEFGHPEHLRMAYICLAGTDIEPAFGALRDGLRAFLEHHGAGPEKYHETLTRAWLIVVRRCMEKTPDTESAAAFLRCHPGLLDRDLLEVHYSRERLFSDEARRSYLPPDRAPFPGAGTRGLFTGRGGMKRSRARTGPSAGPDQRRTHVIERCRSLDQTGWLALRQALWPHCTLAEHHAEMSRYLSDPDRYAQFVCYGPTGDPLGFAEAAVRTDHVNGASSSPVPFLEGIYVVPRARRRGLARALFEAVEAWGRRLGYSEVASDALLGNEASHEMHRALGFEETQRVVFFAKSLASHD